MSIKLTLNLREITSNTPLGSLVRARLNKDIGTSLTADASIRLKLPDSSFSSVFRSKVDTGAYMTLLPPLALDEIKPVNHIKYSLYGVNKTLECAIECAITDVDIIIIDSYGVTSPTIKIWVAIAIKDDIPPLLGMRGILDTFEHYWNPSKRKLQIIFPSQP
ncbi:MAG: hypothetical protein ACTSRU_11075 [Candidatus Hodarchaeales archaeon]